MHGAVSANRGIIVILSGAEFPCGEDVLNAEKQLNQWHGTLMAIIFQGTDDPPSIASVGLLDDGADPHHQQYRIIEAGAHGVYYLLEEMQIRSFVEVMSRFFLEHPHGVQLLHGKRPCVLRWHYSLRHN